METASVRLVPFFFVRLCDDHPVNVSVIIPVINEEQLVAAAIEAAWQAGADEVIVVDGGSTDRTRSIASGLNCHLIESAPGRGRQQNQGAAEATGDVLLFLHVDTRLDANGCRQIRELFERQPETHTGIFRQRIDNPRWIYRWIEAGNRLRVWWQNLAYGDQGIFIRREWFHQLNGFPDVPLMEDVMLSQQIRRSQRFVILPGPLLVAARRWEKYGPLRQTFRNWTISTRFRFGASPEKLATSYRRHDQQ